MRSTTIEGGSRSSEFEVNSHSFPYMLKSGGGLCSLKVLIVNVS